MSMTITTAAYPPLVRPVDLPGQVAGGDRVDVVLEGDREHARRGRSCGTGGDEDRCGGGRRGEKCAQESRFHSRKDSINVVPSPFRRGHTEPRTLLPRMLRIALVCLFVFPASAWAGQATIVSQELPIGVSRTTAGAVAPARFNLVGLHWQGSGTVLFRTHSVTGRWSAWQRAAPEDEDQPDHGTAETRLRLGWRLGNPYWVGPSDRIGWRLIGDVRRVRAWYVWSPVGRSRPRAHGLAGRLAEDHAPLGLERERGDPPPCTEVRQGRLLRDHPPHGRVELLRAGGVARDRPRHRALPRARERLERHRLQLPRRQVRPGVRGPRRRNRPERDRRAGAGLQHRLGRGSR